MQSHVALEGFVEKKIVIFKYSNAERNKTLILFLDTVLQEVGLGAWS
jgi:hypothetical protein